MLVDVVDGEPRMRGRIAVLGGRMEAPAGAYEIDGGYIAFWGGDAEPEMYLRGAFLNRRGMRYRVSINGPLGAPEVSID